MCVYVCVCVCLLNHKASVGSICKGTGYGWGKANQALLSEINLPTVLLYTGQPHVWASKELVKKQYLCLCVSVCVCAHACVHVCAC